MMTRILKSCVVLTAAMALVAPGLSAQRGAPPGQGPGGRGGQGRGGGGAYPARVIDPDVAERGRAIYSVNCAFCHGQDTRGGDTGPSLLRSQLVQDDRSGETIAAVVRGGRPPQMPAFNLTDAQLADLSAFLHSFQINSRDPARMRPPNILTGDAAAGETYFKTKCASCHSTSHPLTGIASRFADPRALQQFWILPGNGGGGRGRGGDGAAAGTVSPTTATITLPSGQKYEGRLAHLDEFIVSIVDADGATRSFRRTGAAPKVDVHDPLEPHKALLRAYTDTDIHNVTAYLVTLK
jgi:cytochrome c oxidase cbb3-type subunit III